MYLMLSWLNPGTQKVETSQSYWEQSGLGFWPIKFVIFENLSFLFNLIYGEQQKERGNSLSLRDTTFFNASSINSSVTRKTEKNFFKMGLNKQVYRLFQPLIKQKNLGSEVFNNITREKVRCLIFNNYSLNTVVKNVIFFTSERLSTEFAFSGMLSLTLKEQVRFFRRKVK